jgi:hypothetical protein
MAKQPLRRVDRHHKCPICGRSDWCTFADDIAICMRVESPRPSANGGWVHKLDKPIASLPPAEQDIGDPRRPDDELDKIYRRLLGILSLSQEHREHLLSRGMSDDEIKYYQYRTLPAGNRSGILAYFNPVELRGVPGFGFKGGQLRLVGSPGILIPMYSFWSHLVSFTIRPDIQEEGRKYMILSSKWLKAGANPSTRLHLSVPPEKRTGIVWIVEGPLKANMVSWRLGAVTIAVPGVGNWQEIKNIDLPSKIRLAYDADYSNPIVQRHARLLSNYLLDQGCRVEAVLWDKNLAKGPDDALVEGVPFRYVKLVKR